MTNYLIKYEYDYADEFDVHGMEIVDKQGLDKILLGIKSANYPKEEYFGTNEALEFENENDVKNGMTITELTPEESVVMKKFIRSSFGHVVDFESWKWDNENYKG